MSEERELNIVGAVIATIPVVVVFLMWLFGAIDTDLAVQLEIFWLTVLAAMLGYQVQFSFRKLKALLSK